MKDILLYLNILEDILMRGGAPQYNEGRPYDPYDEAKKYLSHVPSWDPDTVRSSYIPNNSRGFGAHVYNAINRTSNRLSSLEVAKNEITRRLSNTARMNELLKEREKLQDEETQKQKEINKIEKQIGSLSSYLKDKDNEDFKKYTAMLRDAIVKEGLTFDNYIKEYKKNYSGYSNKKSDEELKEEAIVEMNKDITNREKISETMDNDFRESKKELDALEVQLATLLKGKKVAQSRIQINNNDKIYLIQEAVDDVLKEKGIVLDEEDKNKLVVDIKRIYRVNKVGGYKSIKKVVKKVVNRPVNPSAKPATKRPVKKTTKYPVKKPTTVRAKPSTKPAKPAKRPVRK